MSSSLNSTQQWTISWSDCDMQRKVDFIWQLAMTSLVVGLSSSSKALPKAKHASGKGHGHCLIVCCLPDPLQLSESHWNHYIWEVRSANWWDALKTATPAAALVSRKGPIFIHDVGPHVTPFQKLNELGYKVLPNLPYSPDCSPITSSISTTFCKENASKSSSNPEAWIFTLQEKTFLTGKNLLIIMVPILINKDVFKPSYNDIKFMVWNCNYFCTNLIALQWKNLAHITMKSKWSSFVMWHHGPGDMLHWKGCNITSTVFMQNMHNLNLVKGKH